jgi:hypothetical protein
VFYVLASLVQASGLEYEYNLKIMANPTWNFKQNDKLSTDFQRH